MACDPREGTGLHGDSERVARFLAATRGPTRRPVVIGAEHRGHLATSWSSENECASAHRRARRHRCRRRRALSGGFGPADSWPWRGRWAPRRRRRAHRSRATSAGSSGRIGGHQKFRRDIPQPARRRRSARGRHGVGLRLRWKGTMIERLPGARVIEAGAAQTFVRPWRTLPR